MTTRFIGSAMANIYVGDYDRLSLVFISQTWNKEERHYIVKSEDIKDMSADDIMSTLTSTREIDRFSVPTKEYWDHYFNCNKYEYSPKKDIFYEDLTTIKIMLESGDLDKVVKDDTWYDGWFRTIDGDVIPRKIYFDYIEGFSGTEKEMMALMKKLKGNKRVTKLEIEEVPYYNSEPGRTHGLRFYYMPTKKEIGKIIKEHWAGQKDILEKLASG